MKKWHPSEVLVLAIGLLLLAQCVSVYPGELVILATTTCVVLLTRSTSPARWFMMLVAPLGFLLTTLIVAPVSIRGDHGVWGAFYLDQTLLRRAESSSMRSLASISCTLLLLCSRSPVEWAAEIPRGTTWRFLADLLVLMERYFYLLRDAAKAILLAQEARLSRVSRKRELFSFAMMCSCLLARTEQRARNLQDALDARLYEGELLVRRVPVMCSYVRLGWILSVLFLVALTGRLR